MLEVSDGFSPKPSYSPSNLACNFCLTAAFLNIILVISFFFCFFLTYLSALYLTCLLFLPAQNVGFSFSPSTCLWREFYSWLSGRLTSGSFWLNGTFCIPLFLPQKLHQMCVVSLCLFASLSLPFGYGHLVILPCGLVLWFLLVPYLVWRSTHQLKCLDVSCSCSVSCAVAACVNDAYRFLFALVTLCFCLINLQAPLLWWAHCYFSSIQCWSLLFSMWSFVSQTITHAILLSPLVYQNINTTRDIIPGRLFLHGLLWNTGIHGCILRMTAKKTCWQISNRSS